MVSHLDGPLVEAGNVVCCAAVQHVARSTGGIEKERERERETEREIERERERQVALTYASLCLQIVMGLLCNI